MVIATTRHILRVKEFLKELDYPINKTNLGRETNTLNAVDSVLKFMVKENWVGKVRDVGVDLYYLKGGKYHLSRLDHQD